MADRELSTIIEGPKGKAEVYEVSEGASTTSATSGVMSSSYEVVMGDVRESVMTLGEASIVAHEFSGAEQ